MSSGQGSSPADTVSSIISGAGNVVNTGLNTIGNVLGTGISSINPVLNSALQQGTGLLNSLPTIIQGGRNLAGSVLGTFCHWVSFLF